MTARVVVAVRIEAPPARVFEAFTAEIGTWWRADALFPMGEVPGSTMTIEPGVGGRFLRVGPDGDELELGRVRAWEPPARLVMSWRPPTFGPELETEVRVEFRPVADATRVVVEHVGWDAVPRGHAARHGFPLDATQRRLAERWQRLAAALHRFASDSDR